MENEGGTAPRVGNEVGGKRGDAERVARPDRAESPHLFPHTLSCTSLPSGRPSLLFTVSGSYSLMNC